MMKLIETRSEVDAFLGFKGQEVSVSPYGFRACRDFLFADMIRNIIPVVIDFKGTEALITCILDNRRVLSAAF
ncbi:MAG: hypothetical protein O8C64_10085 [Candidatus Methanoperedens sp.]|nr:hypothetical protein [Candidatus Methanoperedens sp.]